MGLYPLDALGLGADAAGLPTQTGPVDMDAALSYIESRKDDIVAIGEVGLDFKMDDKFHAAQKVNFERIIALSEKIKKPMIIHSRGAESDIVTMLESSKVKKAVLHCFSGNKKLIQKAADLGLSFSIPANIVKMQHFQLLVSMVNSSQLLTETDAPWLGPVSGVRNVPQNVRLAVEKIAEIKGLDIGGGQHVDFQELSGVVFAISIETIWFVRDFGFKWRFLLTLVSCGDLGRVRLDGFEARPLAARRV